MNPNRYDHMAATLHWLTVALLIAIFSVAFYMETLVRGPGSSFGYFVAWHKNLGISLFLLIIIRLAWRFTHSAPSWPAGMPRWQHLLADSIHGLLYLLLLLQPIIGYLSSSFSGFKTSFWGMALPHWGSKNKELNEFFTEIHEIIALALLVAISVHVAAALAHAFLPKFRTGHGRMPPFPE